MTTFCPVTDDTVEITIVSIRNISSKPLTITPTAAVPIFGRSADNLRDHRHATSLMHRMTLWDYGVSVKPEIHHDERGHEPNNTHYFVLASECDGGKPVGMFPTVMEYVGDGGSFDWPEAVVKNLTPDSGAKYRRDGMEAVGAVRFEQATIAPGETREYIVICGITDGGDLKPYVERYGSSQKAAQALEENKRFWLEKINAVSFQSGDSRFDSWMKWVNLQPHLRKIFGCSFLPYHDYGSGGRGWRDLWQDCLALLLQNPEAVRQIMIDNFGGVRMDGSNATIILKGSGNFMADRNKVSRVWMDHGVWPYFSIKLYIDQTGDVDILFEKSSYWRDHQARRAKSTDAGWLPQEGNRYKDVEGRIYQGTLLEHLLLQHLTCFCNAGDHNNIKLEDGDWNDQLDMAPDKGETVPFTAFLRRQSGVDGGAFAYLQKEKTSGYGGCF